MCRKVIAVPSAINIPIPGSHGISLVLSDVLDHIIAGKDMGTMEKITGLVPVEPGL